MSSGIFLRIGALNAEMLPEREALCTVRDGEIIAVATWTDVPAGHYHVAHVWNHGWSKTFHLDIKDAHDHDDVTASVHISWPGE